jgi:pimeloyl-ACP methyl ester carboxylesterase
MTFYLIPGLGTDDRLFRNLRLEGHRRICLNWIEPADNEAISEYAQRLSSGISPTEPFALIGVSFGGMVAIEMAKTLHPEGVFVISSVTRRSQLPWYFRAIGRMRLHRLFSVTMIKQRPPFLRLLLGKMTPSERRLITDMLYQTSSRLLKWSVNEALMWKNEQVLSNVLQIHGSHDMLILPRYIGKAFLVEAGTHLMILQKAEIIERLITSNQSSRDVYTVGNGVRDVAQQTQCEPRS